MELRASPTVDSCRVVILYVVLMLVVGLCAGMYPTLVLAVTLLSFGLLVVLALIRFPLVAVIGIVAASLLLPDQMTMTIGFPAVGLNLIDLLVLLLGIRIFLNPGVFLKRFRQDRTAACLFLLLSLGIIALLLGMVKGAQLRHGLRDFRFFAYTFLLYFAVVLFIEKPNQIWLVVKSLFVLSLLQFVLVAARVLNLNPIEPDLSIIAPTAGLTLWHFLESRSFFPMFISISLLAESHKSVSGAPQKILWVMVAISAAVLLLSLNRTLWAVSTAGILFLLLFVKRTRGLAGFAKLTGVILIVTLALRAVSNSIGVEGFLNGVRERLLSYASISIDAAIATRLGDTVDTFGAAMTSPIWGHGLGLGDLFVSTRGGWEVWGAGIHMGYAWLAYRIGFVGLAVFVWVLLDIIRLGLRSLQKVQVASPMHGLMAGLTTCLFAFSFQAFFGTNVVHFALVPYWGLLIGLVHATARFASHGTSEVGVISSKSALAVKVI